MTALFAQALHLLPEPVRVLSRKGSMIKLTRLSGEIIYLNYLQVQYIETIPETKVKMVNGDYYLVKDTVDSILQQVKAFMNDCIAFDNKQGQDG